MKNKFDVNGMTCSSCSSGIERTVSKLDGVESVVVNLLSNNMTVEYDEEKLNVNKIMDVVEGLGYEISEVGGNRNKDTVKDSDLEENLEIKSMKKRLIVSFVFLIPLMYIAMYHMLEKYLNIPTLQVVKNIFDGSQNAGIFVFTQFLLVLPIILINNRYYKVGFKALINRRPNMDSLIAIGSMAAFVYGIFAIYRILYGLGHENFELVSKYSMDIYFESAGTILSLITLGKYLETKSKMKTGTAIKKLMDLSPKMATVYRNNEEVEVMTEDIVLEDIIIIKPGMNIPVDGLVLEGNGLLDQSSITGESMPVEKEVGDKIISGTINKNGYFKYKVTKVGKDTTLAQIISLVEEASNSKAPIAKLADEISGIFVPIVIGIAILAFIYWILVGQSFEFALSIGIAVLVISCPCALGLATPVAIIVGTGKGAENGILIKSAESLEILHSVDTVVFDKTGTLTKGEIIVTDIIECGDVSKNELLSISFNLEKHSEHPLAEAVIRKAKEENCIDLKVLDFENIPGKGIIGSIKNLKYIIGNKKMMIENQVDISKFMDIIEKLANQGKTPIYIARNERIIGIIGVKDVIKEDSKSVISKLKKMNIEPIMLTGDNKLTAEVIKKEIRIDKVFAEVLPAEKDKVISDLQKQGKRVAMCGDGINDSPALARADVGIAIGNGTDVAIESADVILMNDGLTDVIKSIKLSKNVIRNIKMNLFWAFFYNVIGIPLAAGILYNAFGWKLNPMFGAAAMSLSSICVVLNALRIKRFRYKENGKYEEETIEMKKQKK